MNELTESGLHERTSTPPLRLVVAYLMNQYPSPTHTFIRSEIEGVEQAGVTVHRFSHRRSAADLVDETDLIERSRTTVLTEVSLWRTVYGLAFAGLTRPLRLARAVLSSVAVGLDERRLVPNVGYVLLACILADRMHKLGLRHIHAHMATNAASVAMYCKAIFGFSFSFTAHSAYEYELNSSDARNLDAKVANAEFVVAVSEHGKLTIQKRCPQYAKKVHLIRCGLDDWWLQKGCEPIPSEPRLVAIARLEEDKDPITLVRAASRVRASVPEFRLTLVGDGSLREPFQQEVKRLDLEHCVSFVGWKPREGVFRELQNARAMVLSSRVEGLPTAVMEAFAVGRPVIATDVGGVKELVVDGRTGWIVPPENAHALSAAMLEVLTSNRANLSDMAARGRALVVLHHSSSGATQSLITGMIPLL